MDFTPLNEFLGENNIDSVRGEHVKSIYKCLPRNEAGEVEIFASPNTSTENHHLNDITSNPLPLLTQYLSSCNKPYKNEALLDELKSLVLEPSLKDNQKMINQLCWASIHSSLQEIHWRRPEVDSCTMEEDFYYWPNQTRVPRDKLEPDFESRLVVARDDVNFKFKEIRLVEEAVGGIVDQDQNVASSPSQDGSLEGWLRSLSGGSVEDEGLLAVAPGMSKGLVKDDLVEGDATGLSMSNSTSVKRVFDMDKLYGNNHQKRQMEIDDSEEKSENKESDKPNQSQSTEIDKILDSDQGFTLNLSSSVTKSKKDEVKKNWAHVIDVSTQFLNFKEMVPDMAHKFKFELDTFQKHAVYHLEKNESVFVAAHTSAGKTVVAEYAISLAKKHMTKAIYTSPIKALSNQKYRDFRETFNGDVGLLTGDIQINPEASCLIMTTEILRSMLYRNAPIIRDTEFLIFDEVHYVNDMERGVVWEEVIIMLPRHVTLVMLSATVPNVMEFAGWIGRTKQKDVYVISTEKRPVPLEHFLWNESGTTNNNPNSGKLHMIVNGNRQFHSSGYREAMLPPQKASSAPASPGRGRGRGRGNESDRGGRGGGRGGRGGGSGGGGGGRGVASDNAKSLASKLTKDHGSGGGEGGKKSNISSPHLKLIQFLRKGEMLPAVFFTFSKRRCEENVQSLGSSLDLLDKSSKSEVHSSMEKALSRLKGTDRQLPQIMRMKEMLSRGIAVHHSGLLPIMKECVEILFSRGFVKVLFATETFAMGVNMPTRTAVFTSVRKHDGIDFRNLLPGEYTQMSGRAGRRGLDTAGTVIIMPPEENTMNRKFFDEATLKTMILGTPTRLSSQFRLTYNMILCLLRVQSLRIEDMLKSSFGENHALVSKPENEKQLAQLTQQLGNNAKLSCAICEDSILQFYEDNVFLMTVLWKLVNDMGREKLRYLYPGRILVLAGAISTGAFAYVPHKKKGSPAVNFMLKRNVVAVLLKIHEPSNAIKGRVAKPSGSGDDAITFDCFICYDEEEAKSGGDVKESKSSDVAAMEMPPMPISYLSSTGSSKKKGSSRAFMVLEKLPLTQLLSVTVERIGASDVQRLLDEQTCRPRSETAAIELASKLNKLNKSRDERAQKSSDWSLEPLEIHRWRGCTIEMEEELLKRRQVLDRFFSYGCLSCPKLDQHYGIFHNQKSIQDKMLELENRVAHNNLALLPDYKGRVQVLERLGYIETTEDITENGLSASNSLEIPSVVTLKGRVACEINTCNELVTTELLFEGFFSNLEAEEIVAIMSCLVFQEKSDWTPVLTKKLEEAQTQLEACVNRVLELQAGFGLEVPSFEDFKKDNIKYGLVEVVYEWARGMQFKQITDLTDVLEGSIVRCIVRLDETCRELRSAARLIGDAELYKKMEKAGQLIKRDICFAASLYY